MRIYKIRRHVRYITSNDNIVIVVGIIKPEYIRLNKTGSDIFRLIVEGSSKDEIVEKIANKYCSNLNDVEKDVRAFIMQLLEQRILKEIER